MTDALPKRGVPNPTASLAAKLGVLSFKRAFAAGLTQPTSRNSANSPVNHCIALRAASAALSQHGKHYSGSFTAIRSSPIRAR